MTDSTGEITYAARYMPWGDTLESYGTGSFAFGYFGGVMDAATGLLYVGDGQYYDPSAGRFLTRTTRPNQTNPYLPIDPTGALFAPLGLLAMYYVRRKKGSKWGARLALLLVVVSVGMGLSACKVDNPTGQPIDFVAVQATGTPTAAAILVTPTTTAIVTFTPPAPLAVLATPCPTPTLTPTTIDEEMAQYGVYFTAENENIKLLANWDTYKKGAVKKAVIDIVNRFGGKEAFKRIYGHINFEWCQGDCADGYMWAYNDHTVRVEGMYPEEYKAVRLIVHELGHVFDRKVCASRRSNGVCDDVFTNSARTDLGDIWDNESCGKASCLGRTAHSGPLPGMYYGFAGGWEDWQFGGSHGPGEVWADMFFGWVYEKWDSDPFGYGDAKKKYMNSQMAAYLAVLR